MEATTNEKNGNVVFTLCLVLAGSSNTSSKSNSNNSTCTNQKSRVVIQVPATTTTVAELHAIAARAFHLDQGSTSVQLSVRSNSTSSSSSSHHNQHTAAMGAATTSVLDPTSTQPLWMPPRCDTDADTTTDATGDAKDDHDTNHSGAVVRNQDCVTVTPTLGSSHNSNESTLSLSTSKCPPRRAAAERAKQTILDKVQQEEQPHDIVKKTKGKSKIVQSHFSSTATAAKSRAHFAALERACHASSSSSSSSPNTTTGAVLGGGRRLQDGARVATPLKRKARTAKHDFNDGGTTMESILLERFVPNGSTSRSSALLRHEWRRAVDSVYEQNQASSRVAAAATPWPWDDTVVAEFGSTARATATATTADEVVVQWHDTFEKATAAAAAANPTDETPEQEIPHLQLRVTYPKRVQGRGHYVDTVEYLPRNVIAAALASLHPTEALHTYNLALLSPRVFWSLLVQYHHHQSGTHDTTSSHDSISTTIASRRSNRHHSLGGQQDMVQNALAWACPTLDWSYLQSQSRRPVQLSAKALENARQAAEAKRKNSAVNKDDEDSSTNWQAAASAIAAVEDAMADLPNFLTSKRRHTSDDDDDDETINYDSLQNRQEDSWCLVTPTELDTDELSECILSFTENECENTTMVQVDHREAKLSTVVNILCRDLHLRNWRQLASSNQGPSPRGTDNDNTTLYARIVALLDASQSHTEHMSTTIDKTPDENSPTIVVSSDAVEAWLEYAQVQSIDEIMVEICDGNIDAVALLLESANTGTPKDLALWQSIVPVLHSHFTLKHDNQSKPSAIATAPSRMSIQTHTPEQVSVHTLQLWCNRACQLMKDLEWLADFATPI